MEDFDVVVVGGGPAGSSAATLCGRAGLSVALVDKEAFPRDKLCGGLLTERSRKIFESIYEKSWDNRIINSTSKVEFLYENRHLSNIFDYSILHFTMRFDFDNYLIELARLSHVQLCLGCVVKDINFPDRIIRLANGKELRYQILIAADGVNSQVARSMFGESFNRRTIGFGLEVECPYGIVPVTDVIQIDFGAASWGYGWSFPKQEGLTIGVGGIHRLNPQLRAKLASYMESNGVITSTLKPKGQYIPFGDYRRKPAFGRVLFCGDAAGLVDPITGEGIAYAMQSGREAARSVIEHRLALDRAAAEYINSISSIQRSIMQARFWRTFIFSHWAKRPFRRLFGDAGTLQRGYLDILAGDLDYDALPGLVTLQAQKAIKKLVRKVSGRRTPSN